MIPHWRSLLFVPANAQRRWATVHTRGADAVIVDLEDSIQPDAKPVARLSLEPALAHLTAHGVPSVVRINNDPKWIDEDLEAAVRPGVCAIMLPKATNRDQIMHLRMRLQHLETARGLNPGEIGVLAVIEHPLALESAGEIASCQGVIGLALGSEDFSLALGRPPAPASLDLACRLTAYAARGRGLMAIGMSCGIGDYSDLDAWSQSARNAYAMGMTGALAIHPDQIPALNAAFGPSVSEIREAEMILTAWSERTSDVIALNGRMIDQPVVERARRLLSQAAPR